MSAKLHDILRVYLQPTAGNPMSSAEAVQKILNVLPKNKPYSDETWEFSQVILLFAKQIPYKHESMGKLANLVNRVLDTPEFMEYRGEKKEWRRSQMIRGMGRDWIPDGDDAKLYTNYMTFFAQLQVTGGPWENHILWAIWELRDAFESGSQIEHEYARWEAYTMAAAQLILICGQNLFKLVCEEKSNPDWGAGPRFVGPTWTSYRGSLAETKLTLRRWHFWRDGFRAIAQGADPRFGEECKGLSAEAAKRMQTLELEGIPVNDKVEAELAEGPVTDNIEGEAMDTK